MYSQTSGTKKLRNTQNAIPDSEIYWIPKLNINHNGVSVFEVKVPNKNKLLFINIQGLSKDGIVVNHTLKIDPSTIKYEKNRLKK